MNTERASSTVRIALASPPFPRSVNHAVDQVADCARKAADGGAALVCFPESYVPGMRGINMPVAPHSPDALRTALDRAREIAQRHHIAMILPMDWDSARGIENVAFVIDAQGEVLGRQTKNQLDPTEDAIFVPGTTRNIFDVAGLRFGVTICHEGFRYPESVRWAASRGASVVFHPHCTGSDRHGKRLTVWRGEDNPYFEHAMVCRALENEIHIAGVNYPFRFQASATCVVSPNGECIGRLPYGEPGVLITDIDPGRSTGRLAKRYDPRLYD